MREIGPHKYISFVTPPNYDDSNHWLGAEKWSEVLKDYLAREDRSDVFISEIEINNKNSTVHWNGKNWISTRNAK